MSLPDETIDMHVHVGLVGDEHPELGGMSRHMQKQLAYRIFLLYARIEEDKVCDRVLRQATERVIRECGLDGVVCLALDPVYDDKGRRCPERSHMWVDNRYVLSLREAVGERVRFGASVHPYDPNFGERVRACVADGAVLLKWLPSAQNIDLADDRAGSAMRFLATAGADGHALPLLLHVGPEYAIAPSDPRGGALDYLSWTFWDRLHNVFRRWHPPRLGAVHANLRQALEAGADIIFAHCGLPYFASRPFGRFLEHSDLDCVRQYLERYADGDSGRCFADVSACCTPFRRGYFDAIRKLPPESLLFGSDYPVPVFELSAGPREWIKDFKAVLRGELDRIVVPQDNLLDVNRRELMHAFPGHPMFTNFSRLLDAKQRAGS